MGVAPAQLQSWIAARPTLDEAAGIITKSPMPALPNSVTAMAVKYCIQMAADSICDSPSGAGSSAPAGTTAASA